MLSKKGDFSHEYSQGNSITTAEHAIALLFALARDIPQANQSTHEGLGRRANLWALSYMERHLVLSVVGT